MIMPATLHSASRKPSIASKLQGTAEARFRTTVHFFLDFSNIAISATQIAYEHGDACFDRSSVRLHSGNLRYFVERDRLWGSGFAAAGLINQQSGIRRHFDEVGIEFRICERGLVTGTEQNVDERIRLEILELLDSDAAPGTIALATGDGSGFQDNHGFIKTLSIMKRYGYSIEVMSWRHSFNSRLKDWATEHGRAIELDPFYEDLTFVSGGRAVMPVHRLSNKLVRFGIV